MNPGLLGTVAALAWGTHDFVARFPSRRFGYVNTVMAVTVAGLLLLGAYLLLAGMPLRIEPGALWLVALTGASFTLATMWLFAALTLGPISIVSPIVGSYPAIAVLFAVATGARPTFFAWLAMAAVVIGVVVVSRSRKTHGASDEQKPGSMKWVLGFSFLSSLAFAVSLTSGQLAAPIFGDLQTTWLARLFGLVTIALFYLRPSVRFDMPPQWWPLMLGMGTLDVLALSSVVAAGQLPGSEIATVTSSAFGAITVILARLILRERITRAQSGGIVLIFIGVAALSALT